MFLCDMALLSSLLRSRFLVSNVMKCSCPQMAAENQTACLSLYVCGKLKQPITSWKIDNDNYSHEKIAGISDDMADILACDSVSGVWLRKYETLEKSVAIG